MRENTTSPGRANGDANSMRGIFMSLSVFLMFSALLLLVYNLSVANTRNGEAFTAQAALDRVATQYEAVVSGLSQLPNSTLNYSLNGTSSFILFQTVPATPLINSSSNDFLAFDSFMENYAYTNTSINLSSSLPNPVSIYPQNITLIQTGNTSFAFQPQDNGSGKSISNYTINMVIDGYPAPTISWNPLNSVLASSTDALYVNATARVIGGTTTSVAAYINKSALSRLEFDWGDDLIVNATFNGTSRIGSLNVSADTVATPQELINANFSTNDSNWNRTIGTFSTIAWFNSGQTGGSENITVTGSGRNNDDDVAQNVTVPTKPTSGSLTWCYRVTRWSSGTASNLSVYIRSPGGTGLGTRIDNVSITGTTAWLCRSNSSLPAAVLNDSGTYQFTARAHLQTTTGGSGKFISVLLDDFQLNFTMPTDINITTTMNTTSAIDRVTGGVVPANISVVIGNEFKKVGTNG
jgi:hypothetical protein